MSRKKRLQEREKRLEEKANSGNWRDLRGKKYKNMAEKGILGSRELLKYDEIYCFLLSKTENLSLPSIHNQESPNRSHYNKLREIYSKYQAQEHY